MNHLTDEEQILHFYGEISREDDARVESHLAACEECRQAHEHLRRVLHLVETTPMPAARPGFERDVWARLEPRLNESSGGGAWSWMVAPRWGLAGGVAALVLAAFVAGRFTGRAPVTPLQTSVAAGETSPERVLHAAVGDHLERSQMMLVELVNAGADRPDQLTGEQARAADLVAANRLYRQSAEQAGDGAVADILEDLERVLLEIANAPQDVTSGELAGLKSRIQTEDLLFRVRVIASEMRQRNRTNGEPGDRALQRPPIS